MKPGIMALGMALGGILLCGVHATASSVRTTAGVVTTGVLSFEAGQVVVKPDMGDAVRVPLDETLEVTLDDPIAERAEDGGGERPGDVGTPGQAEASRRTPSVGGWSPIQVGPGEVGTVVEDANGWRLDGGGTGLQGNADSFFFAQQRLEASGQLVARLDAFQSTNAEAMAGIVLRDNVGESAAYAFVGYRGGTGLCFQYRQIASGMTMRTTNTTLSLPAWLRLVRSGGAVVADVSADGLQWQNLAKGNVNLGQSVRAGMAVAAGVPGTRVSASFRSPVVGARGIGYTPGVGYPRCVLRGGSVVIAPVVSADESVIRLGGRMAGALLSALNLARIEFVPLTPELQEKVEAGRQGVLLVDGDYLDGTLRSIATNSVTVSSLLYGFRSFAAGSEVAVVQMGDVETEEVSFRVALRNGSELRARRIEIEPGALRVESPLLGSLVVKREDVKSLKRVLGER